MSQSSQEKRGCHLFCLWGVNKDGVHVECRKLFGFIPQCRKGLLFVLYHPIVVGTIFGFNTPTKCRRDGRLLVFIPQFVVEGRTDRSRCCFPLHFVMGVRIDKYTHVCNKRQEPSWLF
jgi:hypothetical protein